MVSESVDAARYRGLLEAAPDAIVIVDAAGRITLVNSQAERMFGYRRDELLGQPMEILVPERFRELHTGQRETYFRDPRTRPMGTGLELYARRKDGTEIPVEISLSPFQSEEGVVVTAVLRDISERRRLETLQRAFILMIAHDLRNPLTSLITYAELLRQTGSYHPKAVEGILTQARRIDRLASDLLDVWRLEAGQIKLHRTKVDLSAQVRTAVERAQATTTRHQFVINTPAQLVAAEWDADRLDEVLENLLSNAVKYSPEGGAITVEVADAGHEAQVSVQDEGIGIAPDILPHLFDYLYRAEASGTDGIKGHGLGLYIARRLVEAHGGRIWGESSGAGRGSRFVFTLPR